MTHREHRLKQQKQKYEKGNKSWIELKKSLIATPEIGLDEFRKHPHWTNDGLRSHIIKMQKLLLTIEPGNYYHKQYLMDIMGVEKPGTTLNKIYDTYYDSESKVYYIIRKWL